MSFTEAEEQPAKRGTDNPKISVMVNSAIESLKERKGSSLQAIKKYISANYNVDVQKLSHHIKKYLKSAVEKGDIIQPTGKGAAGSFKIVKKKPEDKPKADKVKLSKPLKSKPLKSKHLTSTPMKPLKLKKNSSPNKSPVKKLKVTEEEDKPADSTYTKPNVKTAKKARISVPTKPKKSKVSLAMKVKKPKKLIAKKSNEQKASVSPEGKLNNAISSKPTKTKDAAKPVKVKKSPKPRKPAKKAVKKASINDK